MRRAELLQRSSDSSGLKKRKYNQPFLSEKCANMVEMLVLILKINVISVVCASLTHTQLPGWIYPPPGRREDGGNVTLNE